MSRLTSRASRRSAPTVEPTYKLSSNENPYPPLPGVLAAATEAAGNMNRYPDMGALDLLEALSERFDVPVEHLALGTGSVAVLYHLLQAACADGDEVVYAWRSFEAYPIAVQLTGATSVQVPLTEDARHDFKAMEAALTDRTRVVLVCTPNNPTGPVVRRDELLAFLDVVPRNVLVVVDEAYREFIREPEAIDGTEIYRDRPNVVVLRTFSKAYGLAGFRVGYAIGHPPVIAAIRKCALPFGVSEVAQAAAIASLRAEEELLARVDDLVTERTRVLGELRAVGLGRPRDPRELRLDATRRRHSHLRRGRPGRRSLSPPLPGRRRPGNHRRTRSQQPLPRGRLRLAPGPQLRVTRAE